MVGLIPVLGALSIFLIVLSLVPARNPLSRQLEELQGRQYSADDTGEPLRGLVSEEQRGKLAARLLEAGWYSMTPTQFVTRVIGAALAGLILAALFLRFVHLGVVFPLAAAGVLIIIGAYAPTFLLNRAIFDRKAAVQKALPDFLDMVAATVQAGLAMNAALAYAVDAARGPLAEEIHAALAEVRVGRSRADALKAAADRLQQEQFSTTITAVTQAEKLGSNIGRVLNELAAETRNRRITLVEELAAKLPVKMVIPMAFFMLPALLVIIFGAVAANIAAGS